MSLFDENMVALAVIYLDKLLKERPFSDMPKIYLA
jgi:hypothetical protein